MSAALGETQRFWAATSTLRQCENQSERAEAYAVMLELAFCADSETLRARAKTVLRERGVGVCAHDSAPIGVWGGVRAAPYYDQHPRER